MNALRSFPYGFLLLVSLLTGCGGDAGARDVYPVSGEVTLDGEPLKEGEIVFEPVNASLSAEGGRIVNGMFSFEAPPGPSIVRITSLKETNKTETGAMGETLTVKKQILPERYNSDSTLKADTPQGGKSDFKFELKSK